MSEHAFAVHRYWHYGLERQPAAGRAKGCPCLARIVAAVARAHRRRCDTRHLMALSDHLLRDIGICRSEISHAVQTNLGRF